GGGGTVQRVEETHDPLLWHRSAGYPRHCTCQRIEPSGESLLAHAALHGVADLLEGALRGLAGVEGRPVGDPRLPVEDLPSDFAVESLQLLMEVHGVF